MPGLWRHRDFMLLWAGQSASELGSAVTVLALPLIAVVLLSASTFEVGLLAAATTVPFLLIALVYDRAPAFLRLFVRQGRAVSMVGGLLVVAIGVAMLFDWLALLPRYFQFNTAI